MPPSPACQQCCGFPSFFPCWRLCGELSIPLSVFKQAECNHLEWNTSRTLGLTAIKNRVKHWSYPLKSPHAVAAWRLEDATALTLVYLPLKQRRSKRPSHGDDAMDGTSRDFAILISFAPKHLKNGQIKPCQALTFGN